MIDRLWIIAHELKKIEISKSDEFSSDFESELAFAVWKQFSSK